MIKKLSILAALIALAVAPTAAHAYTCNASGCTWQSSYTEPSTLTNGQPLTDLTGCTASYSTSKDGGAASGPQSFVIAATKPQGGGVATKNNSDATMTPGHIYVINETVACNSTAFGTGQPSSPATLQMNNGVTTGGASGLTLQ